MRLPITGLTLLALAAAPAFAQAPTANYAPGQTVSYEQRAALWGPGSAPVEPFRIVGNVYYVGAANIASYLITTPEGHILLDTGTTIMQADLPRNIEKLGFKPSDVRLLLASHAHVDHIQGHALMQRITGAMVFAMRGDAEAMATGKDLSGTAADGWEPIPIDRIIEDNEEITLGNTTLRAVLAPGHTAGNTTWVMSAREANRTYQIVFGGPPSPVVGNLKYNTAAELAATSFRRLRELNPDMLLGGHPEAQFRGKLDAVRATQRPHPLLLPQGEWRKLLDAAQANYDRKLTAARSSGPGANDQRLSAGK
jgi:metallo-beta-lactamase class B